ncbi:hypothetical protein B0A48_10351 [Cryoendolithus antarcticus]|uniref:ORC6 first cyclin-like domain-containing protein n=1 Tax=Cryoendolithus antarcticus TaxID=1507870 RepID=A0A1V8SX01_9PEZI|nr:hypothetical protein B0A48_10351 [Cryoendolithus antarcticus]
MAAAIERSLHLIVPTAPSLPSTLIDLAFSLLAQSRAKVPKLKQDEEIARTYACCHLACERLKHKANLEIGKIAPPCGPRVYKKLYGFLDSTLPVAPATPKRKRGQDGESGGGIGSKGKVTPLSVRMKGLGSAASGTNTPVERSGGSTLGKRSRGISQPKDNAGLSKKTKELIQYLCKMLGTPEVVTHVYAGVESVIDHLQRPRDDDKDRNTPSKKRKLDGSIAEAIEPLTESEIHALVGAIYLLTTTRTRQHPPSLRDVVDMTLGFLGVKGSAQNSGDEALHYNIPLFLEHAEPDGWLTMDWYKDLPFAEGDVDMDNGTENDNVAAVRSKKLPAKTPLRRMEKHAQRSEMLDEHDAGAAGLLPGLGTMFQPAVDWLSEERQAAYVDWKAEILVQIAAIESRG